MPNPDRPAHSSHRATAKTKTETKNPPGPPRPSRPSRPSRSGGLLPYLIIMAGVAAGLFVAGEGSAHASRGAEVAGGSLLLAALARLVLPQGRAGMLASRSKVIDVLAFAALGGGVLALGLILP
jgi:hypothetical protein